MDDFDWINPDYEKVFATRVERLERMRKPGQAGAPTQKAFEQSAKTAK